MDVEDRVLLYNGNILTSVEGAYASWIIINSKAGTIESLGQQSELENVRASFTGRTRDLKQRYLFPGFHDAHIHVMNLGRMILSLNLKGTQSIKDFQNKLEQYLKFPTTPLSDTDWLFGFGWDHEKFDEIRYPNKNDLDALTKDRPALIYRTCGHIAVVNSKALELLSFTKDTPNPEGGAIDRDAHGNPTGILRENAVDIARNKITPSKELKKSYCATGLEYCLKHGITCVHTNDEWAWDVYKELYDEKKMKIRTYLTVYHHELAHDSTPKPGSTFGHLLHCKRVKILSDGALGSETAAMRYPYVGSENRGILLYTRERLHEMIKDGHEKGYQLEVHAIGDLAAEAVLEGFEMAGITPKDRAILTHCQILGEDLLQKMQNMGVIANIQPQFVTTDSAWVEKRVVPELLPYCYSWKTIMERGIVAAGGSDAPIEDADPMAGIHAAIFRYKPDGVTKWREAECLSLEQALHIYGPGAAYALGADEEKLIGKIQPGCAADFTILDMSADPKVNAESFKTAKVSSVWVAGQEQYDGNGTCVEHPQGPHDCC